MTAGMEKEDEDEEQSEQSDDIKDSNNEEIDSYNLQAGEGKLSCTNQ